MRSSTIINCADVAARAPAIMTVLSHLDPAFASVVSIEAVNEPIMDATQTPGYGDCTYPRVASDR